MPLADAADGGRRKEDLADAAAEGGTTDAVGRRGGTEEFEEWNLRKRMIKG